MENKKTKLTISGKIKKPINDFNHPKSKDKKTVVIDKHSNKPYGKVTGNKTSGLRHTQGFKKENSAKNNFLSKAQPITSDFERRKLAEQRATKRLKGDNDSEKKTKTGSKKRELKLTVSRALSDQIETRERSLASVKRARQKELKNSNKNENKENLKPIKRDINIPEAITVRELANRMAEQSSNVIKFLFGMGVTVTINQTLAADTAEYLVKEFGHNPIREEKAEEIINKIKASRTENLKNRPPIITVMGHVDHGKTSVLDVLRSANVVSGEFGGITQHIGAYQIDHQSNKLTFIDTPGHAAFTEMRARGSKITDIVILVVAANDGIKPQTIEAINHSKAAGVPIIVAVNKCDLQGIDTTKVKNQLLEHELIVEEMGGEVLCNEISALKKINLDKLKENILLQSELLDLRTKKNALAKAVVIESRLDKGRGPVSTVLITSGTLKKGDTFISGSTKGKVRAMFDYNNKQINSAEPSMPVEVIGFENVTKAGDDFIVLNQEEKINEILEFRKSGLKKNKTKSLGESEDIFGNVEKSETLNIVLKADVHGSLEAINAAITKIEIEKIKPKIILSAVGPVTETDVTLAKASNAKILGFNVRPNKEAKDLASSYKMEIGFFNIIYEAIEFVEKSIRGTLEPMTKEENIGQCEVLEVFNVSKAGKVAGVKVTQGEIKNNSQARLVRDGSVVYVGKVGSLFREKNEAKEVKSGLECGLTISNFLDYKKGDVIEVFQTITIDRE